MAFAFNVDGAWVEIDPSRGFSIPTMIEPEEGEAYEDLIQRPGNWPDSVTAEERAAAGIFEIEEPEAAPANMVVTGSAIVGDETPARVWLTVELEVDQLRTRMSDRVNLEAGAFRRRFITDIPGQQATYLAKEQEATAWTVGADPAGFPYLANEAEATGQPIAAIAELVLATAAAWRGLDPKIEGKRRGAMVAIAAAETADDIIAAAAINWEALLA